MKMFLFSLREDVSKVYKSAPNVRLHFVKNKQTKSTEKKTDNNRKKFELIS